MGEWKYWEHHSATPNSPTPLTATEWDGSAEQPIDITKTKTKGGGVVNPGTERWPGDIGVGKINLSWYNENGNYDKQLTEIAYMKTVDPPAPHGGANADLFPTIRRDFVNQTEMFQGSIFGTHASPSQNRRAIMDGMIYFGSWDLTPTSAPAVLSGNHDQWYQDRAGEINDIRRRYDGVVWVCMANEPQATGSNFYNQRANLKNLRDAGRYVKELMVAAGCTNFGLTTPTYIQDSFHDSSRLTNAHFDDPDPANWRPNGVGTGSRWDGWWEYHNDWKGPSTVDGPQTWASWVTPKPSNFYSGTDRRLDLIGANSYCWHAMDGAP